MTFSLHEYTVRGPSHCRLRFTEWRGFSRDIWPWKRDCQGIRQFSPIKFDIELGDRFISILIRNFITLDNGVSFFYQIIYSARSLSLSGLTDQNQIIWLSITKMWLDKCRHNKKRRELWFTSLDAKFQLNYSILFCKRWLGSVIFITWHFRHNKANNSQKP